MNTSEEFRLPFSQDTEKIVLGSCLLYDSLCAEAATKLSPEEFYEQRHRRTFQLISELSAANIGVDAITVLEKAAMAGWSEITMGYVADLTDGIPETINFGQYINILLEKSALRSLIRISAETQAMALRGDFSSVEIVSKLSERISGIVKDSKQDGPQTLAEYIDSFPGGVNSLLDPSRVDPGMKVGFERIDELTGGLHESEIWLIGGYTSSGKTSLQQNIITNLATGGNPVLWFSLEMPKRRIVERMICERAGVSMGRFRGGGLSQDENLKIQRAVNEVYDLPIMIDHRSGLKVSDMAMSLKAIQQKTPVRLVCIDFVQLVRSTSRGSGNDRMTEITTDIQQLAKDTGIPFLIASQLNRESQKRGTPAKKETVPQLSDFRDSGSIEQCANVAMIINRPQRDPQRTDFSSVADIHLLKNRDGGIGIVNLRFVGWKFRFENIDRANENSSANA